MSLLCRSRRPGYVPHVPYLMNYMPKGKQQKKHLTYIFMSATLFLVAEVQARLLPYTQTEQSVTMPSKLAIRSPISLSIRQTRALIYMYMALMVSFDVLKTNISMLLYGLLWNMNVKIKPSPEEFGYHWRASHKKQCRSISGTKVMDKQQEKCFFQLENSI